MLGLFFRAPVAGQRRDLSNYETFNERLAGLAIVLVGAVISDLRVCENDDLTGIGWVSEDFLVTGNGGIENYFTVAFRGRTKASALEDCPVFQGEHCCIQYRLLGGGVITIETRSAAEWQRLNEGRE